MELPRVYYWDVYRYRISLSISAERCLYTVWRPIKRNGKPFHRSVMPHMPSLPLAIEFAMSLHPYDAHRLERGERVGESHGVTVQYHGYSKR